MQLGTRVALDFSVVIPAKNAGNTIARCIHCVLNQNYPKERYEMIVVDNNSKDKIAQIIKQFPVKYIFNKKVGAAATRNAGVKAAKGEIIAFVDSDCFADKNWLKEAHTFLKKNKDLSIAGGEIALDKYSLFKKIVVLGRMSQSFCVQNGFAATGNLFIRKKKFEQLDCFDERLCIGREDIEFGDRANAFGEKIAFLENAIVKYNPPPFFKFLKREFRMGRANTRLNLLRKKGLNYKYKKPHKTLNLLFQFLPSKKCTPSEIILFLAVHGTGKIISYFGQLFENICLLLGIKTEQ